MPDVLPHIAFETGKQPQHSIIWLHGLGADGGDFVPIAEELNLPVPVRYVFPHAPKRPVTINGGFVMRAWYDIIPAMDAPEDAAGIRESQASVESLIAQEVQRGTPAQNIYLAGFSQGGAIVLHAGLRHAQRLGGIIALSTYLPLAQTLAQEAASDAKDVPIFMAHGRSDPVLPYPMGKSSAEKLAGMGYQIEWHEYAMQHSVCMEEVEDIKAWLTRRVQSVPSPLQGEG